MSSQAIEEAVSGKTPKAFSDLKKNELVAAAAFFGTNPEGSVQELRADLTESGITWDMYSTQFLADEVTAPVEEVIPTLQPVVDPADLFEQEVEIPVETLITAPPIPKLEAAERYLIRFIGENPYFERGRYKFSQEKPYAIMNADDAEEALIDEPKKFRQAFPTELKEFYG